MAGCEDMVALVLGAAEGTLGAADRDRLAAHLQQCEACRAALENQRVVRTTLSQVGFPAVSPGFAARVRDRVAPRPTWVELTNWRAWSLRLAPIAALLILLASWSTRADAPQQFSSQLQSWAAGSESTANALLDPDADAQSLIQAAFGEPRR